SLLDSAQRRPPPPHGPRALPGSARRRPRSLPPDDQRDRDRAFPAVAAAGLRPRSLLRDDGRADLPPRHRGAPDMKAFWMSATGQLRVGLGPGAPVFVAFAAGGDATYGLVSAALVLGFLLLVYFGRRRSDTLDVMSGIGDERAKLLYTRAVAFTGTVMSFVL